MLLALFYLKTTVMLEAFLIFFITPLTIFLKTFNYPLELFIFSLESIALPFLFLLPICVFTIICA